MGYVVMFIILYLWAVVALVVTTGSDIKKFFGRKEKEQSIKNMFCDRIKFFDRNGELRYITSSIYGAVWLISFPLVTGLMNLLELETSANATTQQVVGDIVCTIVSVVLTVTLRIALLCFAGTFGEMLRRVTSLILKMEKKIGVLKNSKTSLRQIIVGGFFTVTNGLWHEDF